MRIKIGTMAVGIGAPDGKWNPILRKGSASAILSAAKIVVSTCASPPFDIFLLHPQYFPIACIYMSLASVAREVTAGTDDGAELPLMADGRSGGVATCDSGRSVINEASGDTFTQGGRTAK